MKTAYRNLYGQTREESILAANELIQAKCPSYDPETSLLTCPTHGKVRVMRRVDFSLNDHSCPECVPKRVPRLMTDEQILAGLAEVHNHAYEYSDLRLCKPSEQSSTNRVATATCKTCKAVFDVTVFRHRKGEQPCRNCVGYAARGVTAPKKSGNRPRRQLTAFARAGS